MHMSRDPDRASRTFHEHEQRVWRSIPSGDAPPLRGEPSRQAVRGKVMTALALPSRAGATGQEHRPAGRGRHHSNGRLTIQGNASISAAHAGVAQWQSRSFPSLRRGFDSPRPLQQRSATNPLSCWRYALPCFACGSIPLARSNSAPRRTPFSCWRYALPCFAWGFDSPRPVRQPNRFPPLVNQSTATVVRLSNRHFRRLA